MKLLSFTHRQQHSYGVLKDKGIIDLGRRFRRDWPSLKHLVAAAEGLSSAAQLANGAADFGLTEVELLPVIGEPGAIICIGLNYEDHRAETARPVAPHPTIFLRVPESLQAAHSPLLIPLESDHFDYEGELALVIGKPGRRISQTNAWDHVVGVSCFNDGSVRDWQSHTHQFGPGKNFPRTGAFGPYLVTLDELPADRRLSLQTRVNGAQVQSTSTDQMIFPVPRLIEYVSTFMTLRPGDVIVTGTPGGVGAKREPPLWLKDGDVVEVEISSVGLLSNTCRKEGRVRA